MENLYYHIFILFVSITAATSRFVTDEAEPQDTQIEEWIEDLLHLTEINKDHSLKPHIHSKAHRFGHHDRKNIHNLNLVHNHNNNGHPKHQAKTEDGTERADNNLVSLCKSVGRCGCSKGRSGDPCSHHEEDPEKDFMSVLCKSVSRCGCSKGRSADPCNRIENERIPLGYEAYYRQLQGDKKLEINQPATQTHQGYSENILKEIENALGPREENNNRNDKITDVLETALVKREIDREIKRCGCSKSRFEDPFADSGSAYLREPSTTNDDIFLSSCCAQRSSSCCEKKMKTNCCKKNEGKWNCGCQNDGEIDENKEETAAVYHLTDDLDAVVLDVSDVDSAFKLLSGNKDLSYLSDSGNLEGILRCGCKNKHQRSSSCCEKKKEAEKKEEESSCGCGSYLRTLENILNESPEDQAGDAKAVERASIYQLSDDLGAVVIDLPDTADILELLNNGKGINSPHSLKHFVRNVKINNDPTEKKISNIQLLPIAYSSNW